MESIVIIYQGTDPNELEIIRKTLDTQGIKFYKSLYLGLIPPLDPFNRASDRLKLSIIPWRFLSKRVYSRMFNGSTGFQITILQKDEFIVRKLLGKLELSREICVENPTIYHKLSNMFSKVFLPLTAHFIIIVILVLIYTRLKNL